MNKSVFGKTMENVRKHQVIKREKKGETIWYPQSNGHATIINHENVIIFFSKNLERNTQILINKPVYLGLSILEIVIIIIIKVKL